MSKDKINHISDEKYYLRKKCIMEAAEIIFAKKGFYAATVDDIASEARIAKGTIYLYFKNKEDLFLSIVEKSISNIIYIITKELENEGNFIKKLNIILIKQLQFFENNKNIFKIFISGEQEGRLTIKNKKAGKR